MTLRITRVLASSPELESFLRAHLHDLEPTAPAESRHALPAGRLLSPGVRLFAATIDGILVGTGALAPVAPAHEELKSMRTAPGHRGRGVGAAVLDALLSDAARRGVRRVSLETGSSEFFAPARRLYARAGFAPCPPFGAYVEDPHSAFFSRAVPVRPAAAG